MARVVATIAGVSGASVGIYSAIAYSAVYSVDQETAAELDGRITEAEKSLTNLRTLRQTAQQRLEEDQQSIEGARSSVRGLQQDIEQELSAMKVAEQNAQAARQRADAARKDVNPLNHPIVQRYLQQK
ncbi:hypothetical protein WJX75_000989 [Coccomyxa subellipsoidea]|uniref:Uncharacterized protein n=1 Tax=Coccomyxa subellipsoidea TaxID=248742 RepID=A0ABR2YG34_9CHLO